jgi:Metal binding domain of Ada
MSISIERTSRPATSTQSDPRWTAVVARDANADGTFFHSVKTTGVYCRPSCPARLPRRENVAFHDTATDAEAAGFRPCKRCKPGASAEIHFAVGGCSLGSVRAARASEERIAQYAYDLWRQGEVGDVRAEQHEGAGHATHAGRSQTLCQAENDGKVEISDRSEQPEHEGGNAYQRRRARADAGAAIDTSIGRDCDVMPAPQALPGERKGP